VDEVIGVFLADVDLHPAAGRGGRLPGRIILHGEVSDRFAPAFHRLSLRCHSGYTELRGTLADQSQLHASAWMSLPGSETRAAASSVRPYILS
jgi:hypothetical protein